MELAGKKILVIGLGEGGLACGLFLAGRGAEVRLTENRRGPGLETERGKLEAAGVRVELGGHSEAFLEGLDLVVTSPGVPPESRPIQAALQSGIPVWSELELAYRFCPAPILAVTGTNGKSTVVTLLRDVLKAAGRPVVLSGNIRPAFISVVDRLTATDTVILEVSSFQLEWIERFRPKLSLLLNITADHLDRYPDFGSYRKAKLRIFENQAGDDIALLNYDDPESRVAGAGFKGRTFFYSRREKEGRFFSDGRHLFLPDGEKFLEIPPSRLWGVHNQENILAVCAAARLYGLPSEAMAGAIRNFQPLAHRLEPVARKQGVQYIDDSKATNVDSTLRALQSFPKDSGRVLLILGGKDKGGSYRPLREALSGQPAEVILIGEAAERISAELAGTVPIHRTADLAGAVRLAAGRARPGDTVLLSPACSSFDMFKDYAQRGNSFKEAVAGLP